MAHKNSFSILSLNANGLQSSLPHLKALIQKWNIDIVFVQEVHRINSQQLDTWLQQNQMHIHTNFPSQCSSETNRKSGTCILLQNSYSQQLTPCCENLVRNRIQLLTLTINSQTYHFINIYLPSGGSHRQATERQSLILQLREKLDTLTGYVTLIGDFNMVIDPQDKIGPFQVRCDQTSLTQLITTYHLHDTYRAIYPNSRTFSYIRGTSASRLDRIYTPTLLQPHIQQIQYIPTIFSDHTFSPLITLSLPSYIRQATTTFWKLNATLLKDPLTQDRIKTTIKKQQNSPLRSRDPLSWWDRLKRHIKSICIYSGIKRQQQQRRQEAYLQRTLQELNNTQDPHLPEIIQIQNHLTRIQQHKEQGAKARCRLHSAYEDEQPTSLFFTLEQNQQQRNLITHIKSGQQTLTTTSAILSAFETHYNQIWDTPHHMDNTAYLQDLKCRDLDDAQSNNNLSPLITPDEIRIAIKNLKISTSPGSDGLTSAFYKKFQPLLTPLLLEIYNNAFIRHQLPPSQNQAIIKLLPKTTSLHTVTGYRPISLLNTDYKILSKILTYRLTQQIQTYISQPQQCGLPRRRISNIHRNIQAAIEISKDFHQPLAFLKLDFTKAFDKLSHQFIFDTLQKIGISQSLIKWIRILYLQPYSNILINQQLSTQIPLQRGIRQGCPLSMLLFIIATEPLTQKIQNDPQLFGISLTKHNQKLQQYADDVILTLTDPFSIAPAMTHITQFSLHSGLEINPAKTKIMTNSNLMSSQLQLIFPQHNCLQDLKILGLQFAFSTGIANRNWHITISKLTTLSQKHQRRRISIWGRILLVKTLFMPHIINTARIYKPTYAHLKKLDNLLYKFLWYPNILEPLARKTLQRAIENGGLNVPSTDIKCDISQLEFFQQLLNFSQSETHLWMVYGKYNLSYRLRHYSNDLYNHNMPHRPTPNPTWMHIQTLLQRKILANINWTTATTHSLYQTLLEEKHLLTSTTLTYTLRNPPNSWKHTLLLTNNKTFFTNLEREQAYRVAHCAYYWGHFLHSHQISTNNTPHCKFCHQGPDTVFHVFTHCSTIKQILTNLQVYLFRVINKHILLNQDAILYNQILDLSPHNIHHSLILKLITIFKNKILMRKQQLDKSNSTLSNIPAFIHHTLLHIKECFKHFVNYLLMNDIIVPHNIQQSYL